MENTVCWQCGAPCYQDNNGKWYCQCCGLEAECTDADFDFAQNLISDDLKGFENLSDNTYLQYLAETEKRMRNAGCSEKDIKKMIKVLCDL